MRIINHHFPNLGTSHQMASLTICGVLFLCFHFLCYNATMGENWKLSKKEDLEIERQLKTFKKAAIKSVVSQFGETYDCVDFYKQPAFDHPLLKNFTYHMQMESSAVKEDTSEQAIFTKANALDCPMGTVPIQRITKEAVIRERRVSRARRFGTNLGSSVPLSAVVRTKQGSNKFYGAAGLISIHNPTVKGSQFSASRVKIQNGPDSIEAGWRVDPGLYGDNQTRFYVYTDAGESKCFNNYCPGFVVYNHRYPLNVVVPNISVPGGPTFELPILIIRDNRTGNWNLKLGSVQFLMGYWPSNIFTGLKDSANYAEWGGSAYMDPRKYGPEMGSGNYPTGDKSKDAYIRYIAKIDENHVYINPEDTEAYTDESKFYSAIDSGNVGPRDGHLIFYGGPGLK